jgi:serine/threonine protein kinase
MAPECLDGRVFTTANDIWAYGIVLWEIFSLAKTPFKRETTADGASSSLVFFQL